MAKLASDNCIDQGLKYISEQATKIYVCTTGTITTFANVATYDLTTGAAVTSANLVIGNGDASGRKIAVAAQSSLSVAVTGTAGQIAITSSDELLIVTNCTTQALTTGNTVTIPTWDIEIADPT